MTIVSRSRKSWKHTPIPQSLSLGEETLAQHLYGLKFEREYKFCVDRKWRADFAFPDAMLLVEVEGGTWSGGRHSTGSGYRRDLEKYNRAAALGWTVLRYTTDMVISGWAEREIRAFLDSKVEIAQC